MQNLNLYVKLYEDKTHFTREELIGFYNIANGELLKDLKEDLNRTWGTDFNKKQDFIDFALLKLQKLRNEQTEFDETDLRYFIKLTDGIPSQYKKLEHFLNNEPKEFVKYICEYFYNIIERNNYRELAKRGMIQAKSAIKNFENFSKYILESVEQ